MQAVLRHDHHAVQRVLPQQPVVIALKGAAQPLRDGLSPAGHVVPHRSHAALLIAVEQRPELLHLALQPHSAILSFSTVLSSVSNR